MSRCYCCGTEVPDNAKFCPKCGKTVEISQDLIDRAKADDPDAQTELYERTYKTVYSRIRAKVSDSDTVMDIMQETYLSAFTNLNQLQKAETFPSWLLTIASRQVCDWYRKNGKENENIQMSRMEYENVDTISDEDDILEEPEYRQDFSPDESLDRAETGRLLSEILNTLPGDQRIILVMRYYDEMSLQEISDELGVNLSTVKTRLTAGKKKVEAKVLELEKSGTKLYSLGPVAFLVFLLHHAELFAPAISANSIIGLTAAGAGTAAGGAAVGAAAHAAAGVTGKTAAGAAVKAAGGAAVKGIGVRIAAVAAAVVVAGGITTAVIVTNNDHTEAEPTTSPEDSVSEEAELPSNDTVMEMAEDLNKWIANSDLGSEQININLDTACELAATLVSECGYTDGEGVTRTDEVDSGGYTSEISEEAMDQCLHDLFGSEYQAEDFQNTEESGMIQTDYPDYHTGLSGHLVRNEDGNLYWDYTGWEDVFADAEPAEVTDISPVEGDEEICIATVRYDWYISDETGEQKKLDGSADVTFRLKSDDNSRFGWVITAIQEDPYTEVEKKAVKSVLSKNEDGSYTSYETYDIHGNILSSESHDTQLGKEWNFTYTYDSNGNMLTEMCNYSTDYDSPFWREYRFDDSGNLLTETHYSSDGSISSKDEYTYDSSGNLLTETQYSSDESISSKKDEYTYDSSGNLLTETHYSSDVGTPSQKEYTYDSNGNKLTETEYESNGNVTLRYEYTYDNNGNVLTETEYESNGNIFFRDEYTYDNNGNVLIQYSSLYDDGEISSTMRYEYTYDSNGNMLTETHYTSKGKVYQTHEFTYDSSGNLLTEIDYNENGAAFFQREYAYDSNGNLLLEKVSEGDGIIQMWNEYTYDSNGNMLTRTSYDENGEIDYYEEHTYDGDGNELTGMWNSREYRTGDYRQYLQYENTYEFYERFPGDLK